MSSLHSLTAKRILPTGWIGAEIRQVYIDTVLRGRSKSGTDRFREENERAREATKFGHNVIVIDTPSLRLMIVLATVNVACCHYLLAPAACQIGDVCLFVRQKLEL